MFPVKKSIGKFDLISRYIRDVFGVFKHQTL